MKDIVYFMYHDKGVIVLKDHKGNTHYENKEGGRFLLKVCKRYGSTYEARKQSVLLCIKGKQKLPLLLSERYRIIFFPIFGTNGKENIWIQYAKVEKIKDEKEKGCRVVFCGNEEILLPIGIRSLRKQMKRCKTLYQFLEDL